jgi:hypothetical protein
MQVTVCVIFLSTSIEIRNKQTGISETYRIGGLIGYRIIGVVDFNYTSNKQTGTPRQLYSKLAERRIMLKISKYQTF